MKRAIETHEATYIAINVIILRCLNVMQINNQI